MTDVEQRVRGALEARAGQITVERLRFAEPPTIVVTRRRSRRWWWLTVPAAAAVAAAFALFPGPAEPDPVPILPAGPPAGAPSSDPSLIRPTVPPAFPPTPSSPTVSPHSGIEPPASSPAPVDVTPVG
ncbi:hypothetical protein AB0M02_15680 [Actinoplanes sp. NPDC051861]|uniref:hypothetical protein n=1 Tax=Actinoplanes sp. NPDC051861 TaxID=3155170 RepID=UPI0034378ED6